MKIALVVLATLSVGVPAAAAQEYDIPKEKPKAVKITAKKAKGTKRTYKVRVTVVLKSGTPKANCEGGKLVARAKPGGKLTSTFDAKCHSDFKVKVPKGFEATSVTLRATFKGTETLRSKKSKKTSLA